MINPQNLIPITSHSRAVELGRKGGLSRSKKKQWTNLKYCTQKCPYSGMCPFMTASMASPDKLCALKQQRVTIAGKGVGIQPDIIESFFSLFEDGKEGLIREALSALFKLRLKSQNASSEELRDYFDSLIDMKKTFYPEKQTQETNIQINFKPDFITRMESDRRMRLRTRNNDIIDTTSTIKSEDQDTGNTAIP